MQEELPHANWKHKLRLVFGWLTGFRVEGNSMKPTLEDGDSVFIEPANQFRAGDIVLTNHPFKKSVKILKRIESITLEGAYFLVGDNPTESTDSRSFGAIPAKEIIGKAVCRLK
ncbi:MAG: nickel-type superoxide dismutase maturation protease [Pyrinomonadaceae bacterium]